MVNGRKSTVAKGLLSAAGAGGVFATGVHGVSVAPDGTVFGVETSGDSQGTSPAGPVGASRRVACST